MYNANQSIKHAHHLFEVGRMTARSGGDPHTQLVLQVLKQFRLIYGSVKQHFREVEAVCEVSGSQLWLLQEIGRTPAIGISELAERMSVHQSTASLLVEKLVIRKLVSKVRSTVDQRRVGLSLTAAGEQVLKRAPGPAEGLLPEALAALPDVALQTLHVNLLELTRNLRARDERYADKPLSDI